MTRLYEVNLVSQLVNNWVIEEQIIYRFCKSDESEKGEMMSI